MKIVNWNCGGWSNGGFNINKYNEMKCYRPDILLIQEITRKEFDIVSLAIKEEREKLIHLFQNDKETKYLNLDNRIFDDWYGDDIEESNKGLAIFSVSCTYNIELVENFKNEFRYVVPYRIKFINSYSNEVNDFILLSIWTKPPNYQKTIFDALEYYNFKEPIILAGDFNTGSNKNNMDRYEELKNQLERYDLKNCAKTRNMNMNQHFTMIEQTIILQMISVSFLKILMFMNFLSIK